MSERTSGWELFGRISATLAVAASVIAILGYIFPHAEDIEVTGHFQSYSLPPNVIEMLERIQVKQNYPAIREYVETKQNASKYKLDEGQILEVISLIEDIFKETWDDDFRYRLQKYTGFIYLTVRNTGSKTAKKVVLDIPANGIALVTNQDDSQTSVKFNKKIELDDIRPNNSTNISIWSEKPIDLSYEDDFSISHANGVGDFRFGKTVYGFSRFIDDQAWLLVWIFSMLAVFFVPPLWTSFSARKRKHISKAQHEKEQQGINEPNNATNHDAQ